MGGSAALALHGLPVDPRDLDLVADGTAAAQLIAGLGGSVMKDEAAWDRGDVRAARRAMAIVEEVEVELLVDVEVIARGKRVLGPPDLDDLEGVVVDGRWIPVLPLTAMCAVLVAMGDDQRAEMVRRHLHDH
ncbi:MAG: hypothetical protein ABSC41_15570 [Acidimicrobiales bacterium]